MIDSEVKGLVLRVFQKFGPLNHLGCLLNKNRSHTTELLN